MVEPLVPKRLRFDWAVRSGGWTRRSTVQDFRFPPAPFSVPPRPRLRSPPGPGKSPDGMNRAPPPDNSPTRGLWLPAAALLALVTAGALTGPWWFPLAAADGSVRDEVLQRTFHTAWSTMLVLLPVVVMFWRRRISARAAAVWRVYWTLGYVAYAVHLVWAVGLFFRFDLTRMLHSPEFVTVPRLGMVVTVWLGDRRFPRLAVTGRTALAPGAADRDSRPHRRPVHRRFAAGRLVRGVTRTRWVAGCGCGGGDRGATEKGATQVRDES